MSNPWALDSLPQPLLDFLHHNAIHPSSPLQLLLRQLDYSLTALAAIAYPFLSALLAPAMDAVYSLQRAQPEVFGFAFFVLTISVAVVVMSFVRRILMWWTKVVMNLFFFAALVVLAAAVWENGVFESTKSVVILGSKLMGWCAAMGRYFWAEWERYERETERARQHHR